jgi:hypothetical protein
MLVPVGSRRSVSCSPGVEICTAFEIARGGSDASNAVALARVPFSILKFPEGSGEQEVTITVTEPSAGVFSATTLDTAWIAILGVFPLG